MSIILEATAKHLRTLNAWDLSQCDIQPKGQPPPIAANWYVSVDDDGVDQRAGAADDTLICEIYKIKIAVWRRKGELPKDREKDLQKNESRYKAMCESIDSLERKVLWAMAGWQEGLATGNRQLWRAAANEIAGFPSGGKGDVFSMPLIYQGRSGNEEIPSVLESSAKAGVGWIGRRLQYRGGDRWQDLRNMR